MKINRTQRIVLFAAVLFAVSVGVYMQVNAMVNEKMATVADLRASLGTAEGGQQALVNLRNVVRETANDHAALNANFIDIKNIVGFLETIDGLGRAAGVKLDVSSVNEQGSAPVTSKSGKTNTAVATVSLTLSFEGTWTQVVHFLALVEQAPYVLHVERGSLERTALVGEVKPVPTWTGSVQVLVDEQ